MQRLLYTYDYVLVLYIISTIHYELVVLCFFTTAIYSSKWSNHFWRIRNDLREQEQHLVINIVRHDVKNQRITKWNLQCIVQEQNSQLLVIIRHGNFELYIWRLTGQYSDHMFCPPIGATIAIGSRDFRWMSPYHVIRLNQWGTSNRHVISVIQLERCTPGTLWSS